IVALVTGSVNAQQVIKAKIGIKIITEKTSFPARSEETIKLTDRISIYVIPENNYHVNVIYSDLVDKPRLITIDVKKGEPWILPSENTFFQPDGSSDQGYFTVICSQGELPEVRSFFSSEGKNHTQWSQLENDLVQKSNRIILQTSPKPPSLGGVQRGLQRPVWSTKNLPTLSAEPYLIKRYKFNFEK
ncbi:MAG: hypothetical protein ACE5EK_09265, partial [Nitrospinales bacterium]